MGTKKIHRALDDLAAKHGFVFDGWDGRGDRRLWLVVEATP